jgi:hypothetical protein
MEVLQNIFLGALVACCLLGIGLLMFGGPKRLP